MPNCAVLSCKNYSRKVGRDNGNISFHAFPRDPKYKEIWIDATGQKNWFPNQYSRICSIHFKEDSYTETNKFRRLAKNAIPTIDVLKTLTNAVNIDENTAHEPTRCNTRKRKLKKDIHLPSVSSKDPSLLSPKKRKLIPKYLVHKIKQKHNQIRLREQNRRKGRKMFTLVSLVECLKKKNFIQCEQANLLINTNVTIKELYSRRAENGSLISTAEYSPEFRSFALTLYFYSSKGYNYLREVFNLSLPHPHIIEKWYNSMNGKPGFTTESLKALKLIADKSQHPLYCCLMINEMPIRKNIEWGGEGTYGYVEFGAALDTDAAPEATDALVFLVTGINAYWKVPVGYFLIDGATSEQKANLVMQCLKNLNESKIVVCGLTFEGYVSNLTMAKILGCKLEPNDQMNTTFKHPITKQPIAVFLDPSHMMQLVTMCLRSYGNIIDGNGQYVSWAYFELLNKLQTTENRNIDVHNPKEVATQLLGKSVVKSLDFCREKLKSQDFKEPSATVDFIRIFNDLFDILNSRNFKQFGFKQPINLNNKARIMDFFDKAENYITGLRDPQGGLLIESIRRTGFVGLLVCIKSTKVLFQTILEEERMKFLTMNRFSQEHLKLFFCNVRAHSGCKDDPTARQFESFYKKILSHVEIKNSNEGSFVQLEQTLLNCSSAVLVINSTRTRASLSDEEADYEDLKISITHDCNRFCSILPRLTEFSKQNTTYYIAGYVVRALRKIIKCGECNNVLSLPKPGIDHTFEFVTFNDECGPVYPSKDVVQICRVAEFEIQQVIDQILINKTKPRLINKILRALVNSNIFSSIAVHQFDQSPTENHLVHLIKAVANTYIDVRFRYLTKHEISIMTKRQIFKKLISFQWQ